MKIKKMRADTFCRVAVGVLCLGSALAAQATTWTYSKSANTITDGECTLKVSSFDKTKGTLGLNGISGRSDSTSAAVVDLCAPLVVTDSSDSSKTTINSINIAGSAFADWNSIYNLAEIRCDIIGSMGDSAFAGNKTLTKIEIGGTAETLPGLVFNRSSSLKTIALNFPNLRKVGDRPFGTTVAPNPVDVSTYAPPGVTNIVSSPSQDGAKILYGDLTLTNIMTMAGSAFNNSSLTNVTMAGTLGDLASKAFAGSSITNVVLDLPNLSTIATDAFNNQTKIRRVELVTALPDMGLVTNIVRFANNSNIGDLRIYVSRKQWTPSTAETYDADTNQAGFFAAKSTLTPAETATIDAETLPKVIGVLVKGGTRKGIFVHKVSIHDPLGMFIRIR